MIPGLPPFIPLFPWWLFIHDASQEFPPKKKTGVPAEDLSNPFLGELRI